MIVATKSQGPVVSDRKGSYISTHVREMRVHSKHKVPTAMIIMKGPRATKRQRLPTTRSAK